MPLGCTWEKVCHLSRLNFGLEKAKKHWLGCPQICRPTKFTRTSGKCSSVLKSLMIQILEKCLNVICCLKGIILLLFFHYKYQISRRRDFSSWKQLFQFILHLPEATQVYLFLFMYLFASLRYYFYTQPKAADISKMPSSSYFSTVSTPLFKMVPEGSGLFHRRATRGKLSSTKTE